jgi:hypothetical protein
LVETLKREALKREKDLRKLRRFPGIVVRMNTDKEKLASANELTQTVSVF